MENLYIALVPAREICSHEQWPCGLAVYYDPGSISIATGETLSYCFLYQISGREIAVCSRESGHLNWKLANEAIKKLDRKRRRVDANLPNNWPRGIHPEMQQWAKMIYRLCYFEPDHNYVAQMLRLVQAGNVLSTKQVVTVQNIYRERGSVGGLRNRQLIQWRLMRLSEIDLNPKDRKTISDLAHYAHGRTGLRKSQVPVIGALEEKYRGLRLETTKRRAKQIAVMLNQ